MTDEEQYAQILKEAEPVDRQILNVLKEIAASLHQIDLETFKAAEAAEGIENHLEDIGSYINGIGLKLKEGIKRYPG